MKKLFVTLSIVSCAMCSYAATNTIPSSQLPIYSIYQPTYRFLLYDPNASPTTNGTMRFDFLADLIGINQSNRFDLAGTTTNLLSDATNGLNRYLFEKAIPQYSGFDSTYRFGLVDTNSPGTNGTMSMQNLSDAIGRPFWILSPTNGVVH